MTLVSLIQTIHDVEQRMFSNVHARSILHFLASGCLLFIPKILLSSLLLYIQDQTLNQKS